MEELARGVIAAGGAVEGDMPKALEIAREVWAELQNVGTNAFPCLVELYEIRFVYQWDDNPPFIAIMLWDDEMWRDMAHVVVPDGMR